MRESRSFQMTPSKKEMVEVDERGEGEKAGGKIGVKQTAGEPRAGNKESDATGDQCKR